MGVHQMIWGVAHLQLKDIDGRLRDHSLGSLEGGEVELVHRLTAVQVRRVNRSRNLPPVDFPGIQSRLAQEWEKISEEHRLWA